MLDPCALYVRLHSCFIDLRSINVAKFRLQNGLYAVLVVLVHMRMG
jgi:hypothetical protein